MKITTVFALASLIILGIADQVKASNNPSTTLLEIASHKYMMTAQTKTNQGYPPEEDHNRRSFVSTSNANSGDNCVSLRRGSGRKECSE